MSCGCRCLQRLQKGSQIKTADKYTYAEGWISISQNVREIFRSPNSCLGLFWTVVGITCLSFCILHISTNVNTFLKYPSRTIIKATHAAKMQFPRITLCSANFLNKTKLYKQFSIADAHFAIENFVTFPDNDYLQNERVEDFTIDHVDFLNKYSYKCEDFVAFVGSMHDPLSINKPNGKKICKDAIRLVSNGRMCYGLEVNITQNTNGIDGSLILVLTQPLPEFNSQHRCDLSNQVPKTERCEFYLHFSPRHEEFTAQNDFAIITPQARQIGDIDLYSDYYDYYHSNYNSTDLEQVDEDDYEALGTSSSKTTTIIQIEETDKTLLSQPYGYCVKRDLKYFTTYDRNLCINEKEIDYWVEHCGCIPFNLLRRDLQRALKNTSYCQLYALHKCYKEIYDEAHNEFADSQKQSEAERQRVEGQEDSTCPPGCHEYDYNLKVQASQLPVGSVRNLRLTEPTVVLIHHRRLVRNFVIQEPSFTATNLVNTFGSSMSLWIGFKITTIFQMIYFTLWAIKRKLAPTPVTPEETDAKPKYVLEYNSPSYDKDDGMQVPTPY